MSDDAHALEVRIAGRTLVVDAPSLVAPDQTYVDYDTGKRLEHALAVRIAELGLASGPALRFLRRAVGLRRAEVAELLGETESAIVAWEEPVATPPRSVWLFLAALVGESTGVVLSPRVLAAAVARSPSQPASVSITIE